MAISLPAVGIATIPLVARNDSIMYREAINFYCKLPDPPGGLLHNRRGELKLTNHMDTQQQLFDTATYQAEAAGKEKERSSGKGLYARVLVNVEARILNSRIFTYRIPAEFEDEVQTGIPVLVPFGKQPAVTGYVISTADRYEGRFTVKEITDVLDSAPLFDEAYFRFLEWVSAYYATPLVQVLDSALPAALTRKIKKTYSLNKGAAATLDVNRLENPHAQKIVRFLKANDTDYTARHIAGKLKMSQQAASRTLARLRQLELVDVHTLLSGRVCEKTARYVCLSDQADESALTKRQRDIVVFLRGQGGEALMADVIDRVGTTAETIKRLAKTGQARFEEKSIIRNPSAFFKHIRSKSDFTLTQVQQQAVDAVMDGDNRRPYLLYGVTGSGKTEVYLTLARKTLDAGRAVLVMVPEIALTSHIARRFMDYFGKENIALWHSNLSEGERADTWRRLATGELKILIGARSAIWSPMKHIGLIVIDEEHDESYKQDTPAPRYNAKTLAAELAIRSGAKVVMGSATPDVASFRRALESGRVLRLPERFGGREMAGVRVVDMKREAVQGNRGYLSRDLIESLKENMEWGEQSIVLINRRGFYTVIRCGECDHVFECPNCDMALTYHKQADLVRCHYCNYETQKPEFCPRCASYSLVSSGVGTQRVEEEIRQKVPGISVLRIDSDVLQKRHAYREVFEQFARGEADVLLGTQMVAKGLDIQNVTLACVVAADSTFSLPDFKSAERGFQLLTQVAGRSGRGEKPGRVLLQAVMPDHPVIQHAGRQDYESFYEEEIQSREQLEFPPFSQLFRFIVSSETENGFQFAVAAAEHLRITLAKEGIGDATDLIGPASCVIARLQGRYRYHFLVKNKAGRKGHKAVTEFFLSARPPEGMHFLLDVDAQSLL